MNYRLWTKYAPVMLRVTVRTEKPQNIVLKVFDVDHAYTVFTDRTKVINGVQDLYVRMPVSPGTAMLSIYNEKIGNVPKGVDDSFDVVDIKQEELQRTLSETKMDTASVRNFVSFAQKFCFNAGWIPANKEYTSGYGNYKIEYVPFIVSNKTGEKMATPARVSTANGRIQISQDAFRPFTIPMRMAIILHEYSHYYLNTDISNETEADLNGLTIYLGLGYPIREAYEAFGVTFIGFPSEQNKRRYDIIDKFIREYVSEHKIKDVYATG
jgi:hypothetical protein